MDSVRPLELVCLKVLQGLQMQEAYRRVHETSIPPLVLRVTHCWVIIRLTRLTGIKIAESHVQNKSCHLHFCNWFSSIIFESAPLSVHCNSPELTEQATDTFTEYWMNCTDGFPGWANCYAQRYCLLCCQFRSSWQSQRDLPLIMPAWCLRNRQLN